MARHVNQSARLSAFPHVYLQHFFDGGVAVEDAAQAVLPQRDHAKLDRFLLQGNGRRAFIDQFANRIS